jgi:hypothetical protein
VPASCPDIAAGPCLIEARGSVQRGDFGMTGHHAVLSSTVKLGLLIRLHPNNR